MWVGVRAGVGVDFSKPKSESESESLKFGRLRSPGYSLKVCAAAVSSMLCFCYMRCCSFQCVVLLLCALLQSPVPMLCFCYMRCCSSNVLCYAVPMCCVIVMCAAAVSSTYVVFLLYALLQPPVCCVIVMCAAAVSNLLCYCYVRAPSKVEGQETLISFSEISNPSSIHFFAYLGSTMGGGTDGEGTASRCPLECEILTLAVWALHGKNGIKSWWCPPPPGRSRSAVGGLYSYSFRIVCRLTFCI